MSQQLDRQLDEIDALSRSMYRSIAVVRRALVAERDLDVEFLRTALGKALDAAENLLQALSRTCQALREHGAA